MRHCDNVVDRDLAPLRFAEKTAAISVSIDARDGVMKAGLVLAYQGDQLKDIRLLTENHALAGGEIRSNNLYFTRKCKEDTCTYSERIYIREGYYLVDAVTIRLLKGAMFLFAAFGLVDIAYDPPSNRELCGGEGGYLIPYDGLRYVRITPLGEYVIGKTAQCPVATGEETARIILDDQRLIMTIEGRRCEYAQGNVVQNLYLDLRRNS